jgi:hypothetical protein
LLFKGFPVRRGQRGREKKQQTRGETEQTWHMHYIV